MVCHETYKDADGNWVAPDEVEKRGGKAFLTGDGRGNRNRPVRENVQVEKKNVIAPEAIIDDYGADTIRWFMLSDTPPERDIEWTDAGAEGCWRFVQRVHRLVDEAEGSARAGTPPTVDDEVSRRCARPPTRPSRR